MRKSRTHNSLRNSAVAIVYAFIYLFLNFISRKVFLDVLGADVLGLNTTASNLLQFLNLAELGIGFAVAYTLYKPLAERNEQLVYEIVRFQGMLYKRIAFIVIIGAIVISFFFPLIFSKMTLPIWYAYASFGVLLYSALLSYFVNYKQIVLTANQEEYKITLSFRLTQLLKIVIQIIVIKNLPNGYMWWLITELIFASLSSVFLNYIIRKNYKFLFRTSDKRFIDLRSQFSDIEKKIKQLFVHKIASFAVFQTSPLIIYAFLSLTIVAYYGNYFLIITGCTTILTSLFNGFGASVGNLIAEGNKTKILNVFEELFCVRFLLTGTLCICVFLLSGDFIDLWIGRAYRLSSLTVFLMVLSMYFSLSRGVVDTFLNGYGLYKDVWAPIAEAIINIGASILGGYLYGLNGILCGVLLSQIIILFLWKPYFLFKCGIMASISSYVCVYSKCLISLLLALPVILFVNDHRPMIADNYIHFILDGICIFCTSIFTIGLSIYYTTSGGKMFLRRIVGLISKQ